MIVRTYGRRTRNRGIPRTCSDPLDDSVDDPFSESLSQEGPRNLPFGLALSSQESSSHWPAFDSDPYGANSSQNSLSFEPTRPCYKDSVNGVGRKSKKTRVAKRELEVPRSSRPSVLSTSTLMEAQEFGEMMEHVDEVNFALDGLRKGQPVRIRRASLLSLLSICETAQQRRLLRTQGMAKTIIDAILSLNIDDSSSNLAAATIFYVLTGDSQGQDDHILESPPCIHFLINLLKPIVHTAAGEKAPSIGRQLLAMHKEVDILQDTAKKFDSNSAAITSKVQQILVSCKEMKSSYGDDSGMERPELCPKWIALLTMEKACLSTISLEGHSETSGAVKKTGGNFKEKLRELGGLDAVFEMAKNCHSDMEAWMEKGSLSAQAGNYEKVMQSLVLLLKGLKIMENATFLSEDNQSHLLRMKGKVDSLGVNLCFTQLVVSIIKILSGLYLLKRPARIIDEKSFNIYDGDGTSNASEMALIRDSKDGNTLSATNSSKDSYSMESSFSGRSLKISLKREQISTARAETSSSTSSSLANGSSLKMRLSLSTSGSCSESSRSSEGGGILTKNNCRKICSVGKCSNLTEDAKFEHLEDSQDPFAFDEDEFAPSKWDVLSGKQKVSQTRKSVVKTARELKNGYQSELIMNMSQGESVNGEGHHPHEFSCPGDAYGGNSGLLSDCLLTAIKVLMNLTNDNLDGCRQIASCGGLETISALIASHFPSFGLTSSPLRDSKENASTIDIDKHLTDQELDLLVAILGLLVNLVEKDGHNRSRLASASVPLPRFLGLEESHRDVIPLLCSIFLANQGAGEGVGGEGKALQWNDEAAVLQGEKEAEKMIVEAYSALLLAFLSTESKNVRDAIADRLPQHNLAVLVPVLDRFVAFHLTLNMISPETHKAVSEVIESCRIP